MEIIQDDKEFPRLNNEDKIILRLFQNHDSLFSPTVVKERSGNMMLFLTRNPDNETYGLYSVMHKVMFNNLEEEISYSLNGIDYVIPFAEKVKAKDFINEVKTYINSRKMNSVIGLWQETNNEKAYYSFHQNGNTVIIIDLLRLEYDGKTFSATYIGSVENYILNPMLPGVPISVTFQSDKEATITPICNVCSTVIVKLKKVF